MSKILKITYLYATIVATFATTFVPAVIRADAEAQATSNAIAIPVIPDKTLTMRITAYSSSPDETDSTPFITASGMTVRDGIVASNVLPFGTKIKMPALFGEKIFTVEDRMSRRMKNVVDIWITSKAKE